VIVFLHGVPETASLWDKVRARIDGDSVALSLPGFGCPRPEGFGATKDEYVAWLVDQLDRFDQPVDLIGHDWGAGLTYRVATAHGDHLHSWAADVGNIMHPDYVWHDFARIWQTPGEGEAFFRDQNALPAEERAQVFEMLGVGHEDAVTMASASDDDMASCILDLYRSATPNAYERWKDSWGPTPAPGLVLFPSDDPFGDEDKSRQVAAVLGADHQTLEGVGHWWPLQAPEVAAQALNTFLASVD